MAYGLKDYASQSSAPTLRLNEFGCGYSFGPLVVGDVSFEIRSGEIVGIHGGNATGKSTFVKGILGLTPRRRGFLSFLGVEVSDMGFEDLVKRFDVSYLPQRERIFTDLSIGENLSVSGFENSSLKGTIADDLHKRVNESASNLSGGEILRLAMTIIELRRSRFVFLDEPTDSADHDTKERVTEMLGVFRECGRTVIIVDHDIDFLRHCCNVLGEVRDVKNEFLPYGYSIDFHRDGNMVDHSDLSTFR